MSFPNVTNVEFDSASNLVTGLKAAADGQGLSPEQARSLKLLAAPLENGTTEIVAQLGAFIDNPF